jgi:hypothetical protein
LNVATEKSLSGILPVKLLDETSLSEKKNHEQLNLVLP